MSLNTTKQRTAELLSNGDILTEIGTVSTGQSPSYPAKATDGTTRYQVKSSNSTKVLRRISGYDPDSSDMLGEFMASRIAEAMLEDPTKNYERFPHVELLNSNRIQLASRYLNSAPAAPGEKNTQFKQGMLQDIVQKRHGEKDHKLDLDGKLIVDGKELSIDKKSFFEALKYSALVGDHDVNLGNFSYVVVDDKVVVGRIDFGHAFNDLIKGVVWDAQKPGVKDSASRGFMLDYLNRAEVNGGITGAPTKLARHHNDFMLDEKFSDELKQDINLGKMHKALDGFVQDISNLCKEQPSLRPQVMKSLQTLSDRIGVKQSMPQTMSVDKAAEFVWGKAAQFMTRNVMESKSIGHMLDVQRNVDLLLTKALTPEGFQKKVEEIYSSEQIATDGKGFLSKLGQNAKIEWLKTTNNGSPIIGTITDYIQSRGSELKIDTKSIAAAVSGVAAQQSISRAQTIGKEALPEFIPSHVIRSGSGIAESRPVSPKTHNSGKTSESRF